MLVERASRFTIVHCSAKVIKISNIGIIYNSYTNTDISQAIKYQ